MFFCESCSPLILSPLKFQDVYICVISVISTMIQICLKSHQKLFWKLTDPIHKKKCLKMIFPFSQGWDVLHSLEVFLGHLVFYPIGNTRRVGADPGEVVVVMLRPPGKRGRGTFGGRWSEKVGKIRGKLLSCFFFFVWGGGWIMSRYIFLE